ncbi:zinc-dependent alcohol dehydrogenase [Paenibacillus thermotolerans]|uniref:zinc-dependent alcohol dehydrogenase n=1 Tax=Paenibacillus thermotolerans TaxID=3027807 RepID=UPI0023689432|nr:MULTISPECIES: zinc-binding dehydrogenase [unclassified Paenibacillus]
MKRAAIVGERLAGLVDAEMPKTPENGVLIKVTVAPMCAEYKGFISGSKTDCLGHEAVGEVVESNSGMFRSGDRVVAMPLTACGECELCLTGSFIYCNKNTMHDAAMAQYIAKHALLVKKIPDDIPDEKAALALCGLGPSFGAFHTMGVDAFDSVLITGLGPVGLGAVVNATFRNARVIAVESNPYRAQLAKDMGAAAVLDPSDPDILRQIAELCGGTGPDYALDCSGAVSAHRLCIDAVRRLGKVAFVGESHAETPVVVSRDLLRKGIHLIGSWHYNTNVYPELLQVIRRSSNVEKLVSHVFPMSAIQAAFEAAAAQQSAKILLKPWE